MIKKINKQIQMNRVINKIKSKLPNYHPDTGETLKWKVTLNYSNEGYCLQTGKALNKKLIGFHIKQVWVMGNHRVYSCDRHGKLGLVGAIWTSCI